MDVVGRNPSAEAGKYFRANVWSWGPIHHLIGQLCSDLLGEEMLVGMGYNNGAGPADQTTCTAMAKSLRALDRASRVRAQRGLRPARPQS
jgi:hypothetical protein